MKNDTAQISTYESNGQNIKQNVGHSSRFTLDGSDALEKHLASTCDHILEQTLNIVPERELEALLLGGGYGRGEGGVLKTDNGDKPYNDLEFYVCLRGNNFLNERKFHHAFHELGEQLSPAAGIEVEFKITSLAKIRQSSSSMFFYDLAMGHRVIAGRADFSKCPQHLNATKIPLSEATRLLMNRCSGLLFASEKLARNSFTADDADFVGRNHAKAQLAFGDVVLAVHKKYHFSCRQREQNLRSLEADLPWLDKVRQHHSEGVEFKLHPRRKNCTKAEFEKQQKELRDLGLQLWLWLENLRLNQSFKSARDYALSSVNKCPETNSQRNRLVNFKRFGSSVLFKQNAARYPRERIFHALALLLWEPNTLRDPELLQRVQCELRTDVSELAGLIAAYKSIWGNFN